MTEKISLNDPQRLSILCQSKTTRGKRSLSDVGALHVDPTRIPDPILRHDATEHEEQKALIDWRDKWQARIPALRWLFAIPNGAKLPYTKSKTGKRFSKEAQRLLSEGMLPGVSDLMLPYPVRCTANDAILEQAGLFIEMKRRTKSEVSPEQEEWIAGMRANGYRAEIAYGWEQARDVILDYLGISLADFA